MNTGAHPSFEPFARQFVRKYWETLKSGAFPMPPNEPIEETVEELLAAISHETELDSSRREGAVYKLRMMNTQFGDWWLFSFRESSRGWVLIGCSARSDDDKEPHDLLGPVYSKYFGPFLRHVTGIANAGRST